MPQADLTSFHSLTVTSCLLVLVFFSFSFYYLVPFWSVFHKVTAKKAQAGLFLSRLVKAKAVVSGGGSLGAGRGHRL